MRKTHGILKPAVVSISALALIVTMVMFPDKSISAAADAINAWLTVILPSLMPFSLASLILINSGIAERIFGRSDRFTRKVFGFHGNFLFLFAASCLSGYPMGAKLTGELKKNGSVSDDEAGFLVNATSTTGPLFLTGSVAHGILGDPSAASVLMLCHYISAVVTAFLNGRIYKKISPPAGRKQPPRRVIKKRIGTILSDSASAAINGMLAVLAFMVLFFSASAMLGASGVFNLFPENIRAYASAVLSGIMEMTSGCIFAGTFEREISMILISFFCGFGGFSIIAQTISVSGANRSFILSKLFQGSLSAALCTLFTETVSNFPIWIPFAAVCALCIVIAEIKIRKKYHLSFLLCKRDILSFSKFMLSL